MQGDEAQKVRRTRLVEDRGYDPWVRAEQGVGDATLLWLPVSSFPVRHNEKAWLSELLDRLANALTTQFALRQELFLQFKNVDEFSDDFRRYVNTCMIRVGIGRAGEEPFSGMPSPEEIQQIVDERRSFDYKDWMADYLVWFVGKDPEGQRRLFSGYGAMMTAFMAPGPAPATPKFNITPAMRQALPVFQTFNVDGIIKGSASLQDPFQSRSKVLFGTGFEARPEYSGIPFIMPMLNTAQFFLADDEKRAQWFSLFDLYINESKADKGILLAYRKRELGCCCLGCTRKYAEGHAISADSMTVNTKDAQLSELQVLPCPPGWEARLLRRPAFPNPEPERGLYARRFASLMETLIAEGLQGQFFLQSWKLSSATGNDLISRNVDRWKLKRGLGVWPHGARPGGWTDESLMNAAAAAFQGHEPRLPLHYLLQLQAADHEFIRAASELSGRGVAIAIFTGHTISDTLNERLPFYKGQVTRRFQRAPFFLPLLDAANLESLNQEEMDEWMGGVETYARESAEDQGLLFVTRATNKNVMRSWIAAFSNPAELEPA